MLYRNNFGDELWLNKHDGYTLKLQSLSSEQLASIARFLCRRCSSGYNPWDIAFSERTMYLTYEHYDQLLPFMKVIIDQGDLTRNLKSIDIRDILDTHDTCELLYWLENVNLNGDVLRHQRRIYFTDPVDFMMLALSYG